MLVGILVGQCREYCPKESWLLAERSQVEIYRASRFAVALWQQRLGGTPELARFGDRMICPNCKNAYAQRLREGVARAGFVRYGGFWLRFVAVIIDGIILAIPVGILQMMLFAAMGLSMTQLAQNPNPRPEEVIAALAPIFGMIGLTALVGMAIGCAYEAFFLVKFGATPGKMALGLKVVRPDGSGLSAGRAIGRYFGKMLSGMILYIGYIMAGFDAQKRALHDMICDTRVIKTR